MQSVFFPSLSSSTAQTTSLRIQPSSSALQNVNPSHLENGEGYCRFRKFLRPLAHKNDTWNYSDRDMTEQAPGVSVRCGSLMVSIALEVSHRAHLDATLRFLSFSSPMNSLSWNRPRCLQKSIPCGQKLDALHTLFMRHRFQIPSPNKKRDFRPYDINNADTWSSRQNHLAYECAGWLASHEGGPLYGRIKILEPNQPRFTIIKANSWVDYSRSW